METPKHANTCEGGLKMTSKIPNPGDILIYETTDGQSAFEVNLKEETVWLSQNRQLIC